MAFHIESCSIEDACAAFGENEKLLNELLDKLQEWLKLQPHLPQDIPKKRLEHFLLGTKMNLEKSKRKLDMHYTMRSLVPEIFTGLDPRGPSLTLLHSMMQILYLPKLTHEKYRICIMRPCADAYSELNGFDSLKYLLMIQDILITESRSLGNIYIFDYLKINLTFVTKCTPTLCKKTEVSITEAYAKSIKRIHFINAVPLVASVITMAKKALKPKIAARIHVHGKGDYESLYQHVPKSILPKDYGGDEPSVTRLAELWRQKVDENRNWFLEQEKILVDERLRPGPAVDVDNLFGFYGSFRKLDVD